VLVPKNEKARSLRSEPVRSSLGDGSGRGGLRRTAEDARGLRLSCFAFSLSRRSDDDPLARRDLATLEDGLQLIGVERLALEEVLRDRLEAVTLVGEEGLHLDDLLVDDAADLLIDLASGLLRVVLAALRVVLAQEDGALFATEGEGTRFDMPYSVTIARAMRSADGCRSMRRCELAEEDLLGDAATERGLDLRLELLLGATEDVTTGSGIVTPSARPRNDRDLVDRVVVRVRDHHHGVTASWTAVFHFSSSVMTIERRSSHEDLVLGELEVGLADGVLVLTAARRAASLTSSPGRPAKPGCTRDDREVDVGRERYSLRVDAEDRLTPRTSGG